MNIDLEQSRKKTVQKKKVNNGAPFDIYSIGSIIFLAIVLILVSQYYSKKFALYTAGLIFLTSVLLNIEKIKEVFK